MIAGRLESHRDSQKQNIRWHIAVLLEAGELLDYEECKLYI